MIPQPEYTATVCKELLHLKMYDSTDDIIIYVKYYVNNNDPSIIFDFKWWSIDNMRHIFKNDVLAYLFHEAETERICYEIVQYITAMFFAEDPDDILEAMVISKNMRLY